ncbi:hypothetical protein CEXT_449121 [Caerostris extrusa]|uniref:Uncharacterized protein n=1 Tax=Caerostris extrusa TaxID=172846 RepID=A0AAV4XLJ4_CAEEX|nr:hypothetical protein CEXT_449121 [Caerostris extrusa]
MVNHQSHRSRQANSNGSAHITLMANEEESQLSLFWVVNRTTKHATSSSYTITTAGKEALKAVKKATCIFNKTGISSKEFVLINYSLKEAKDKSIYI